MLSFLANTLEQLDLALEHVVKGDENNARFGLMLTDNAVEITLHQIAIDKMSRLKAFSYLREQYEDMSALQRALGQHFGSKIKFAKTEGKMSNDIADSITILHTFRNEVYHRGIQHEPILPTLAIFHFNIACRFIEAYDPPFLSWGSNLKLPERTQKYFSSNTMMLGSVEEFRTACKTLGGAVGYEPSMISKNLADHMERIVEEQDNCIDLIATGGPRPLTRDEAVIETQAWPLAFSEKGKKFAFENGWNGGSVAGYVKWISEHYPLNFRRDPVPAWRKRVEGIRLEANPHWALKKYRSFMDQTATIRGKISESTSQVEAYIDEQIERMRMERR